MGAALAVLLLAFVPIHRTAASSSPYGTAQEPATSLAELAKTLADPDPARAWSAVQGLRALKLADASEKKSAQKVVATWCVELGVSKVEDVRVLRALALGALHELGLPAAMTLGAGCAEDPSARVRLACALALAELGEGAHKSIAKVMESADLVGGALACASLARPGVRSAAATKVLKEAAENTGTFRGMLLSEPALVTLEILEQDVAKLLEARESVRDRLAVPVVKGLNWGGIVEQRPESFFTILPQALALAEPASLQAYAMPSALRPLARTQRLCELYAAVLGHLPRVTAELVPALEDDSIESWDSYEGRTKPWVLTIGLLMQVEDQFVPANEKAR